MCSFLMFLFLLWKIRVFLLAPVKRDVKFFLEPLQVSCFNSVNVGSNYRHRLTVGISQISSNISQLNSLCNNRCSKNINGHLLAWFTNQHLAAFDQICPRLMILFYDLLVDFNSFPRILFSSSSKTGDQLFLAACSVSIISFLTKFRPTFFGWLSFIDEEKSLCFSLR